MSLSPFYHKKNNRLKLLAISAVALISSAVLPACSDDDSQIGPSLSAGEIAITLDSISYDLNARPVSYDRFDARTGNLLLGKMDVKEYGKLECSFVSRLMCVTSLNIADSLAVPERVDSCKMMFGMLRGDLTGDSITPQRLAVYRLNKPLPSDISNAFDPTGYYSSQDFLGSKSFTASMIGEPDTVMFDTDQNTIYVEVPMSKGLGQEVFDKYKTNPEIFSWPQTFSQYFPGIYVESMFGKGCVANIQKILFAVYYHTFVEKSYKEGEETKKEWVKQALVSIPFSSSPEVLSSNNISYKVSDNIIGMIQNGENVITTPGGYLSQFRFPTEDLIAKYNSSDHNMSMISDLVLSIPAEVIENDYGIGITPNLLLIKSSEMKDFFAQNKLPDNKTSFTATYNSTTKKYTFSSMRQYILDMLDKETLSDDDMEFTIVPVNITQETQTNSYSGTVTTYVTKCTPYTTKPTMTRLHTEDALIVFSFSSQYIK